MSDFAYDAYIPYFAILAHWDNNHIKLLNTAFLQSKSDDKCIPIFINTLYILKCSHVPNSPLMSH